MKCPNCKTENPETAKFCRKCGFKLEGAICPNCGNTVPPGARYCVVCGAELGDRRRKRPRKPKGKNALLKRVLIAVLALVVVAGGVIGGGFIYRSMQADSGEEASYDNLLILTDTFTDRAVTDEASAILAAQDAAESLGLQNAMEELEPLNTTEAYGDSYYRLQQYYQGYPVYGRAVVVLADENGEALTLVGNVADVDEDLSFTPSVTQTELEESLSAYAEEELELSGEVSLEEASDDALVIYDLYDEETHLAYELSATLDEELYTVVLDANDGEVLVACEAVSYVSATGTNADGSITVNASYDESDGLYYLSDEERGIYIYNLNRTSSKSTLLGEPVSSNEINSDGAVIFSDEAINYMDTLSRIYDIYGIWEMNGNYYIYANYGDSWDSGENAYALAGMDTDEEGETHPFAYITTGYVTGTTDIDVLAHEYAHGIMKLNIGDLTSSYAGAIEEGFSDIYGCLVEYELSDWDEPDWRVTGDNTNTDRDIANPENTDNETTWDGSSYKYSFKPFKDTKYTYSTIISHSAYLMWTGNNGVGALSVDELAELWYKAMLMFPSDCDFYEVRLLVELAAQHMGLTQEQQESVSWAFDQVGISEEDGINYIISPETTIYVYDVNGKLYQTYTASTAVNENSLRHIYSWKESDAQYVDAETELFPSADGTLTLTMALGMQYRVTLTDYADNEKQIVFTVKASSNKDARDTLIFYTDFGTVETGTLSGTIVSASDSWTAIDGASITVLDGDTVVEELTADENGAFEVELIPDTYTVQIEKEGYQSLSSEVTVVAGESTDILFSLPVEINDAGARAAYWAFLDDEGYTEEFVGADSIQYAMYDLNGDGISELLLHCYASGVSGTYYIYGYDGDVFFIGSCDNFNREGTYYSADENALVIVSSGGADWITYEFYEVSDQLTLTYGMGHQFVEPGMGTVTEDNPYGYRVWSFYIAEAGGEARDVTQAEWNSYIDNLTEIEMLDLADAAISDQ